jgi:hypothetical protein
MMFEEVDHESVAWLEIVRLGVSFVLQAGSKSSYLSWRTSVHRPPRHGGGRRRSSRDVNEAPGRMGMWVLGVLYL